MMRKREFSILCCLLCGLLGGGLSGELEQSGRSFVLGFLDTNSSLCPQLYVIPQTSEPLNVTISMPADPTFTPIFKVISDTQSVTSLELPASVRMTKHELAHKGLLLESTSDIVLYAINTANGTSDVFLMLPSVALGAEYLVVSYKPSSDRNYLSQIGIIAANNNTQVTVTIPNTLNRSVEVFHGNRRCHEGETFNETLDVFGTLQLESTGDLTGVRITATNPIVVLSGNTAEVRGTSNKTKNKNTEKSVDLEKEIDAVKNGVTLPGDEQGDVAPHQEHVVEQLSPAHAWGRTFATVPFSNNAHEVFRVVASQNDTSIKVKKKASSEQYNLSESEHAEIHVSHNDYINIESDKPILVLQYLLAQISPVRDSSRDSFMLLVPPIEERRHRYVFSTMDTGHVQGVNLVVADAIHEGLLLDGKLIHNTSKNIILIEGFHTNYSAVKLSVKGGRHNLSHQTKESHFAAISYGYSHGMQPQDLPAAVVPPATDSSSSLEKLQQKQISIANQTVRHPLVSSPVTADQRTVHKATSATDKPQAATVKVIASDGDRQVVNEAAAQPSPRHMYPGYIGDGNGGISPAVLAVIISLSASIFFVIVCIVGFIIAEYACRREGGFRQTKVAPFNN